MEAFEFSYFENLKEVLEVAFYVNNKVSTEESFTFLIIMFLAIFRRLSQLSNYKNKYIFRKNLPFLLNFQAFENESKR